MAMESKTSRKLVGCLFLVALSFSTATAATTCCDFSSAYYCDFDWVDTSWEEAPAVTPDTSAYPGFYPNDGYYAWIQDQSGEMLSVQKYDVTSASTTISFSYFFGTLSPLPGDYLKLYFRPNNIPVPGIQIASYTVPTGGWVTDVFTCDSSIQYCCGSLAEIPCSGTLEIVANLDTEHNEGLFGVDNICSDGSMTTSKPYTTDTTAWTTPQPITLPPPIPGSLCCHFDTNVCGFSTVTPYWYWSLYNPNPYIPPTSDNLYLWTPINSATLQTEPQNYVDWATTFSLLYYVSSPSGSLAVNFVQVGYAPVLVDTLFYTGGTWVSKTIAAISSYPYTPWCQGSQPCSGTIQITFIGSGYAAIDDTDTDGACSGSLPCCYFDDPYFCHLIPDPSSTDWRWSGSISPVEPIPPPSPVSEYVYFEKISYIGAAYSDSLVSSLITIRNDALFIGNFYVITPKGAAGGDGLGLNFRELTTGVTTSMDFITDTSGIWYPLQFQCNSVHGDCCQNTGTYCQGYLELTALVDTDGGTVFYGIDSLEIDNKCPTFPTSPTTVTTPTPTTVTTTTPTTTIPLTLPPPVPGTLCCQFDTDVCGFMQTAPYWYWSRNTPTVYIPAHEDDLYLWTDISGATLQTETLLNIDWATTFSLSFFISSPTVSLEVSFVQIGYIPISIDTLGYTTGLWDTRTIAAISPYSPYNPWCIGGGSCDGYLQIEFIGYGYAAIDDADTNGACSGSLPCCDFDDPNFCHLTPYPDSGYWKWSSAVPPIQTIPPPNPVSPYIYFEEISYTGKAYSEALVSDVITLSDAAVFNGNFYVTTPSGTAGGDGLGLNFRELTTGVVTPMDFITDTGGRWFNLAFYCNSIHGDCCQSTGAYCRGTLELTAVVDNNGGTVFYGIDALEIDNKCPSFPGVDFASKSANSTFVPLKLQRKLI